MAKSIEKVVYRELLAAAAAAVDEFTEWEGPEEEERDDAGRSRNERVRVYERLKAAVELAKSTQAVPT